MIDDIDFSNAVYISKNPSGMQGTMIPAGGKAANPPTLGYKVKKWAGGVAGDKKATWRKGRGANKGQINKRMLRGKIAAKR